MTEQIVIFKFNNFKCIVFCRIIFKKILLQVYKIK